MPTEDGGCVYIGPNGPPLSRRQALLRDFQPIVKNFLKIPRPQKELLLHIEFTKHDGMGVAPMMICFNFHSDSWRARLPAIRTVAAELCLQLSKTRSCRTPTCSASIRPTTPNEPAPPQSLSCEMAAVSPTTPKSLIPPVPSTKPINTGYSAFHPSPPSRSSQNSPFAIMRLADRSASSK